MEHIIAGRFQCRANADAAIAVLVRYVARHDICIFHNDPNGQQDIRAANADESFDPGPPFTGIAASATAPAADIIGFAIKPATTLATGGVILAVRITRQTRKELVVADLRNCGADSIEQAKGEWRDATAAEINPAREPHRFIA